jgi:rod shape-determining protein MreC
MRNGGENRGRLLLVILIVSSLFLITLDLRGVNVLDGLRSGTQTALSPFQRAGNVVLTPVKNFVNDITHLGRTRNQIEDLRKQNQKLREQLILRKNQDGEMEQLKSILDLAGTARFKIVSAKVISQGSSLAFTRTITIDAGSGNGIKKNMTVISGNGLVGVVKEVYSNSAIVMVRVNAKLEPWAITFALTILNRAVPARSRIDLSCSISPSWFSREINCSRNF